MGFVIYSWRVLFRTLYQFLGLEGGELGYEGGRKFFFSLFFLAYEIFSFLDRTFILSWKNGEFLEWDGVGR